MTPPIGSTLQDAAYTGNGTAVDLGGEARMATFCSVFGAGAVAGVVTYEAAPTVDYAGTWFSLGTENYGDGACKITMKEALLRAVRARISTMITNGTAKNITAIDLKTKVISGVNLRTKAITAVDLRTKAVSAVALGHKTVSGVDRGFKTINAVDLGLKLITAISKASAASITIASHPYVNGDTVHIVAGDMVELTTGDYVVTKTGTNTFTIPVDSTTFTTYTTGGTALKSGNAPIITTSAAHGYSTGDVVRLDGIVGTTEINGNTYTITVADSTHFSLNGINGYTYTPYTSGGTSFRTGELPTITATSHGYSNGDTVTLSAIVGTTELNGRTFTISGVTTHTFQLVGVRAYTYTAYTSGGKAFKAGTEPQVTTATHGLTTGDLVTLNGLGGTTQLNGRTFVVTVVDTTKFTLDGVDASAYTAYTSGGTSYRTGDYPIVTSNGHGYSNGDIVTFASVGGCNQLNGESYTVAATATNTFQLSGVNGSTFNAYTSGGTVYRTGDGPTVTATAHGFTNGDSVIIRGITGTTELNGNTYTVANAATDTFDLSGVDGSGYTAYGSGGIAHNLALYPVITSNGHGFTNGQQVYIASIVGTTELNTHAYTVAGAATNTFTLSGVDGSAMTAYTSGGTAILTGSVTVTVRAA